jgi:hypothetical protein
MGADQVCPCCDNDSCVHGWDARIAAARNEGIEAAARAIAAHMKTMGFLMVDEAISRALAAPPREAAGRACKDCGVIGNAKACPICGAFTCDGCAENADESCCPAPPAAPVEAGGEHCRLCAKRCTDETLHGSMYLYDGGIRLCAWCHKPCDRTVS